MAGPTSATYPDPTGAPPNCRSWPEKVVVLIVITPINVNFSPAYQYLLRCPQLLKTVRRINLVVFI